MTGCVAARSGKAGTGGGGLTDFRAGGSIFGWDSGGTDTALCAELTDTQTRYPGTNLVLAYSINGHPTTQ